MDALPTAILPVNENEIRQNWNKEADSLSRNQETDDYDHKPCCYCVLYSRSVSTNHLLQKMREVTSRETLSSPD